MADSGLQFFVARGRGLMTIGSTTIPVDCSALDPEIRSIAWKGNSGEVTYNADAGNAHDYVPLLVTDPSPYQSLINAWCTAQAGVTPAIGLGQVQQIKISLVEVLYGFKRQAPIAFTVGAGALNWEATDEAAAAIGQQLTVGIITLLQGLASSSISGLVGAINTALAALTSSANGALSTLTGAVNSQVVGVDNANLAAILFNIAGIETEIGTGAGFVDQPTTNLTALTAPNATAPTVSGTFFSPTITPIAWIPYGATATVNVTNVELAGILGAILSRRQTLQGTRLSKGAAIAALSTVAAAIAYDATAGW